MANWIFNNADQQRKAITATTWKCLEPNLIKTLLTGGVDLITPNKNFHPPPLKLYTLASFNVELNSVITEGESQCCLLMSLQGLVCSYGAAYASRASPCQLGVICLSSPCPLICRQGPAAPPLRTSHSFSPFSMFPSVSSNALLHAERCEIGMTGCWCKSR